MQGRMCVHKRGGSGIGKELLLPEGLLLEASHVITPRLLGTS